MSVSQGEVTYFVKWEFIVLEYSPYSPSFVILTSGVFWHQVAKKRQGRNVVFYGMRQYFCAIDVSLT